MVQPDNLNRYVEVPAEQREARMDADPELDDTLRQRLRELFDADASVVHMTVRSAMSVATAAVVPAAHCVRSCEEIRELAVPLLHGSYYEVRPPGLDGEMKCPVANGE